MQLGMTLFKVVQKGLGFLSGQETQPFIVGRHHFPCTALGGQRVDSAPHTRGDSMVYGRSHERKDIVHGLPGQRFPFPCSGFGLACALFGLRIPGRCLQKLSFEGGKKIGRQFDHRQGVNFILEMRLILTIVLADGLSFAFAPCKIGVHQVSDGDFFPFDGVDAGDGNLRKEFCAFFLNQSRTDALTVSADSFPVAFALGVRETKTVDTIRLTGSRVTFGGLAVENALKLGLYVFSAGYVAHEEIITTNYSNWKMIIHSLSKMYFPENFSNDNTFDLLIILAIILATCEGQRESINRAAHHKKRCAALLFYAFFAMPNDRSRCLAHRQRPVRGQSGRASKGRETKRGGEGRGGAATGSQRATNPPEMPLRICGASSSLRVRRRSRSDPIQDRFPAQATRHGPSRRRREGLRQGMAEGGN